MKQLSLRWIIFTLLAAALGWAAIYRHGPRPGPAELTGEMLDRPLVWFWFKSAPLNDVLEQLHQRCGIRIDVDWEALAKNGITPQQRISGRTYLGTVDDALEGILECVDEKFVNLRYQYEPGRIFVSTKAVCSKPQCRV